MNDAVVMPSLDEFRARCRAWLGSVSDPRLGVVRTRAEWGVGSDVVGTYGSDDDHALRSSLDRQRQWQKSKLRAGFGAIAWPEDLGGLGYSAAHQTVFDEEEALFDVEAPGETLRVSLHFIAPTIALKCSGQQRAGLVSDFLTGTRMACFLLSEPDAGSELSAVKTSAVRDGDGWRLTGQKVWSSGARFCDFGFALARTVVDDGGALTAFLVPFHEEGVEIRPLRQITGEAYFNEVFLDSAMVPDELRVGEVGDGWEVIMTALAIDRGDAGAGGNDLADLLSRLIAVAQHRGTSTFPSHRQALSRLSIQVRLLGYLGAHLRAQHGPDAGAHGSLLKIAWANATSEVGRVASLLLGPHLVADTDEWGTYAWANQLLGAPGIHIAGGTDEIQRNLIGERVLGLPREPRSAAAATATARIREGAL